MQTPPSGEDAVSAQQQSLRRREGAVAAREDSVGLREDAVGIGEQPAQARLDVEQLNAQLREANERLVVATILEPLRAEWANVQATAEAKRTEGEAKGATALVPPTTSFCPSTRM